MTLEPARVKTAIHALCAAIDAGNVVVGSLPQEEQILALASIALDLGLREEVYMLAAVQKRARGPATARALNGGV